MASLSKCDRIIDTAITDRDQASNSESDCLSG